MLKPEQIPMEVQDALNKAHGFIVSPQALAAAINAWPGMQHCRWNELNAALSSHLILPLTENIND